MTNPSLEQFASGVVASGLVPEAEVAELVALLSKESSRPTAEKLATELLFRGRLTKLQVEAIWMGRPESLVLGQYLLFDKIGEGGMGQVFRARHQTMRRDVAIKVLPPAALKKDLSVARFQREVQAAARLSHPHIVIAHDAGHQGAVYYLVLEYVPGCNLAELIQKQGPLPWNVAVDYIRQAALGLQYAHAQGVIHRDVKPGNLLVTEQGTVKVADLGLARLGAEPSADAPDLTRDGVVMGTADFMAPEQAVNTHAADARSDIYSLGCTLYYALSGRRMYRGGSVMERLIAHREQPIPSLHEIAGPADSGGTAVAAVPEALEATYRRMVAKRPEDRFATMADVAAALRQVADSSPATLATGVAGPSGEPAESAPTFSDAGSETVSPLAPVPALVLLAKENTSRLASVRTTRRARVPAWGIGLGLLAVLAGLVVLGSFINPREQSLKSKGALKSKTVASSNATITPAAKGKPALDLDPAKIPAKEQFAWQPEELVAVLGTHSGHAQTVYGAAYSPDGRFLVTTSVDGVLCVWSADDMKLLFEDRLRSTTGDGHSPSVGQLFWNETSNSLWVDVAPEIHRYQWDGQTLKLDRVWQVGSGSGQLYFRLAPKEDFAATWTLRGDFEFWDLRFDPPQRVYRHEIRFEWVAVKFSADLGYFAVGGRRGEAFLWNLTRPTGETAFPADWQPKTVPIPTSFDERIHSLEFDLSTNYFYVASGDNVDEFQLTDAGLQKTMNVFKGGPLVLSDKGRWLCVRGPTGTYLYDRTRADWTNSPRQLLVSPNPESFTVAFTPDETTLLTTDARDQFLKFDLKGLDSQPIWRSDTSNVALSLEFSPDGKRLGVGYADGGVRILSVRAGEFVQDHWIPTGKGTRSLQWTADSATIAFSPGVDSSRAAGLFDAKTGKVQWVPADGYSDAISISNDGKRLAATFDKTYLLLWVRKDQSIAFRRSHVLPYDGRGATLAFSPDGEQLAILWAPSGEDSGLKIWDLRNQPPVSRPLAGPMAATAISFFAGQQIDWSPEGRRLAGGRGAGDGRTLIWNTEADPPQVEFAHFGAAFMRYSADGRRILTAESNGFVGYLVIRNTVGYFPEHVWEIHGRANDVTWHPSGEFVAVANGNGTVYVLRVPDSAR